MLCNLKRVYNLSLVLKIRMSQIRDEHGQSLNKPWWMGNLPEPAGVDVLEDIQGVYSRLNNDGHIMQMFAYFFSVVLAPASMWKLMQKALLLMKWLCLQTPLISVIKLLAFSFLL